MKAVKLQCKGKLKEKVKLEELIPMFTMYGKKLLYRVNLCVPIKTISTVMQMAQYSKISGHL